MITVVLLFQGCSSEEPEADSEWRDVTPSVEAVQAQFGSLPLEERLSGTVRAGNQIEIYPRINSSIEEVYVQNGDPVEEGEPLVRLENREYRDRLEQAEAELRISEARARQAEARLNEARNHLRRQQIMNERDLGSDLELESAEAQVQSSEADHELAMAQIDQARAAISEQEEELSRTVVRSPLTGLVGGRNAEVGMRVDNSTRLFTVGDITKSKILISLTESMVRDVNVGQTARVFSETLGDTLLYGEISRISPFLGQGSFSTRAEIEMPNQEGLLLPGMFVTVDVLYGESEQATIVPISAIYQHPRTGEEGIYIAPGFGTETEPVTEVDSDNPPALSEPTELEFRRIQIVAKGREAAGVVGVESGDWIVTVGQSLMIGSEDNVARIRPASWERIISMQRSQPQDLLREIMRRDYAEAVGQ
ncbi:MAG: efflux RND transporter periplasmic adaptor subunit [Balneolaceae bacterium]